MEAREVVTTECELHFLAFHKMNEGVIIPISLAPFRFDDSEAPSSSRSEVGLETFTRFVVSFEVEEGRFGRETAVELPPFCSHGSFRGIMVKRPTRYCQSWYDTTHAIDCLSSQRVDDDFLSKVTLNGLNHHAVFDYRAISLHS